MEGVHAMIQDRGPWAMLRLHIKTGDRSAVVVTPGYQYKSGSDGIVHDRKGFLEMVVWCNGQQPGMWQYWEDVR
jgi:hypothetical protein